MKIVHICPHSVYNDYWGYQDNLLSKYHRALGHEVTIITNTKTYKNGKVVNVEPDDYVLKDGTRVIRKKYKKYPINALSTLYSRLEVYRLLKEIMPDFIFFHSVNSSTILDAVKYKKKINPNCVIVQDSHSDYFNSPIKKRLTAKMMREYYVWVNKRIRPYISKVYGVTPWRKQYAEEVYKIPSSMTDVLIMGADDEYLKLDQKENIKNQIREKYNIPENKFLIVTGGKIDKKKKIDKLMRACGKMDNAHLIVFGSLYDDIKEEFENALNSNSNITYIGWLDANDVYDYFMSADLVCFPGGHSVMWEQACATKVPCLFEKFDGIEHLNNGGNSDFIENANEENLEEKIKELLFTEKYYNMLKIAQSEKTDVYLYSKIAEKSLECARKIN